MRQKLKNSPEFNKIYQKKQTSGSCVWIAPMRAKLHRRLPGGLHLLLLQRIYYYCARIVGSKQAPPPHSFYWGVDIDLVLVKIKDERNMRRARGESTGAEQGPWGERGRAWLKFRIIDGKMNANLWTEQENRVINNRENDWGFFSLTAMVELGGPLIYRIIFEAVFFFTPRYNFYIL